MQLPNIPADKANHACYGAAIFAASAAAAGLAGLTTAYGTAVASGLVVLAAVGKELLDQYQNDQLVKQGLSAVHGVEVWDAAATMLGGAACLIARVL